MTDLLALERKLWQEGIVALCGIDEAGRGPLAGPVCAAAVIFRPGQAVEGVNDSKKLSAKRREELFEQITAQALAYGVGWASPEEIDRVNILQATFLAMRRAEGQLAVLPELSLVDGNRDPGLCSESLCIVGGDGKSASIAAASILAKVSRDRYMMEQAVLYPQYQFERHMGYPTKLHRSMVLQYGPCPIHRKTFLKKLLGENAS